MLHPWRRSGIPVAARTYAAHATELAYSFRARSCLVRVDKPRQIWLDFLHANSHDGPG